MGAASTLANMVLSQILQPERMARLVNLHRRDETQPSLQDVLEQVTRRIFIEAPMDSPREAALTRAVQQVALDRRRELARSERTARRVQVRLSEALSELRTSIDGIGADAHARYLVERIDRFNARVEQTADVGRGADDAPPGQPIGSDIGLADNEPGCSWSLTWESQR